MKRLSFGLSIAALLLGIVVFSSFQDGASAPKNVESKSTDDPVYFRFVGPSNDVEYLKDASMWVYEGEIHSGFCGGGTVYCLLELDPEDNPGISPNENPEVASALLADHIESQPDPEAFVAARIISTKSAN